MVHRNFNAITFAQRMIEWMSEDISKSLGKLEVPFHFK